MIWFTSQIGIIIFTINLVETKSRNKMNDSLLDDCLGSFIERDILDEVDEDDIIKTFMAIRMSTPRK
jgi:hypothetical protein